MEAEVPLQEISVDIENQESEVPLLAMVTSLREEMNKLDPLTDSPCICRVPRHLHDIKPEAYTPKVVSIGPIHHKTKGLEAMEEYKQRHLQLFLERIKMSLEDYAKFVQDREERLRECYADKIDLPTDEFVRVMMVDSAFVYEMLVMIAFKIDMANTSTRIFNRPCLLLIVIEDLMLLENQIPLFILEDLFNLDMEAKSAQQSKSSIRSDEQPEDIDAILSFEEVDPAEKIQTEPDRSSSNLEDVSKVEEQGKSNISSDMDYRASMCDAFFCGRIQPVTRVTPIAGADPFVDLVYKFINWRPEIGTRGFDSSKVFSYKGVHLLDCLRICHLSTDPDPPPSEEKSTFLCSLSRCLLPFSRPESDPSPKADETSHLLFSVPTITELHQSGVTFSENTDSTHLLSIEFDRQQGILKIPHFFMGDSTEPVFRNLLAFEQCHYEYDRRFTDYFTLLDQLINDSSDVDLLVQSGVLENPLGDHAQAASVINNIAIGLTVSRECYFDDLRTALTKYYKEPWHKWRATLRRDYFNSPWTVISVIAATILLALTIVQTVYAIISK